MFPRSELLHRILVRRKRGKMIAAESLHRDDFPGSQQFGGFANRVSRLRDSISIDQTHARTARWATYWLRVEPTIGRIAIFARTVCAHRKLGHRRARAVVRHAANDRESRTAVGAIREGIAIATIQRIEDLADAVVASRDVGRNQNIALALGVARKYREH